MESSTLKKQHAKAIEEATKILGKQTGRDNMTFQGFELYTLRHTCLTRWAPHMDPWTLAYLAGHRDMNITKRTCIRRSRPSAPPWIERAVSRVGILSDIPRKI